MNGNVSEFSAGFEQFKNSCLRAAKSQGLLHPGGEGYTINPDQPIVTDRTYYGKAYRAICDYLNGLGIGHVSYELSPTGASTEGFELKAVTPDMLSVQTNDLFELCRKVNIPEDRIFATVQNLGMLLYRYTNNKANQHFEMATEALGRTRSLSSIYPAAVMKGVSYSGSYGGMEMFGSNIQQRITDIKTAMAITLFKSYKGITNRIFHRVANETGVVVFTVPADEFYDLAKSQDKSASVRDSFSHRNQLITLTTNPEPVDMEMIPVRLLKKLDPENKFLVADDVMKPGAEVYLFDMSVEEGKVGYDQFNYTDLLSSQVSLKAIHIEIKADVDGEKTEQYVINLSNHGATTNFTHMNNTVSNSADRGAIFQGRIPFDKDSVKVGGDRSEIFAALNQSVEYVQCLLYFSAVTNLQSTRTTGNGSVQFRAALSIPNAEPSENLKKVMKSITGTIVGWEIDARYSEENFRKTNMAARTMSDTYTYMLPDGRTIVYDYSHRQSMPEHVLAVASEIQTIGIDHRNLQIAMKTLRATADRIRMEHVDKRYIENYDNLTVNKAFVSGRRVHPTVAIKTIDMSKIVNFRSSDMLSDTWTYMRACLNALTTEINYRSLLPTQLEDRPAHYKVVSTTPLLDCIFSLASIHENQMPCGKDGEQVFQVKPIGKAVEFKTTLPNGVILEFVTTNFNYMKDTMLLIPYRENDPMDELNFAMNFDGGQYSVNWTPTDGNNMTIRRSMQNTREYPIVTCPIGAIIKVTNYDHLIKGAFDLDN